MARSSIDLDGMASLISSLETAASCLHTTQRSLRLDADRADVPTSALSRIEGVAGWADDELPGLRRRLDIARLADAARPAALRGSTVVISEPRLSEAQACALGQRLAADALAIDATDAGGAARMHDIAASLEAEMDDPAVMAAFWAAVGPDWTDTLASRVATTGADTAAVDFATFSRAFTAALYVSTPPPGFAAITDAFTTRPPDPGVGWNRLALLSEGRPPTAFAQAATRANSLDILRDQPWGSYDFRGPRPVVQALGLPDDALVLALQILAGDPVAARGAISSGSGVADLVDRIYGYAATVDTGDQVADAFGHALEAGTGADQGEPSVQAARFAFQVITASAAHSHVTWTIKDSLAVIAAAYVPEILAGANLAEHGTDTSTMTAPKNWSPIPGVNPRFYLSLTDTYALLRSFGDTDELAAPFDQAAAELYDDVLLSTVRSDDASGGSDAGEVAARLGNLAGVEYMAQKDVRASLDATDAAIADTLGTIVTTGLGKVTPPAHVATWLWKAGIWGVKKGIAAARGNAAESTRAELLDATELMAARLREAAITQIVLRASPGRAATLPATLRARSGGLIEPVDIISDPALTEEFEDWLDSQNPQTHGDSPLGTTDALVEDIHERFGGGFNYAQTVFGEV